MLKPIFADACHLAGGIVLFLAVQGCSSAASPSAPTDMGGSNDGQPVVTATPDASPAQGVTSAGGVGSGGPDGAVSGSDATSGPSTGPGNLGSQPPSNSAPDGGPSVGDQPPNGSGPGTGPGNVGCPPPCNGNGAGDGAPPVGGSQGGPPNSHDPPPGMPHCQGNALLQQSPISPTALKQTVPLGNLAPTGGHVFPSDHSSLMLVDPNTPTPVFAPADITISVVGVQTRSGGPAGSNGTDYVIEYYPCADVLFIHGHMTTLAPTLLAQLADAGAPVCTQGQTGSWTVQQCWQKVYIDIPAGTQIGTAGAGDAAGIDFQAIDRRVPKAAYVDQNQGDETGYEVCPFDYFANDAGAPLVAMLGGRGMLRTAQPVCGTVMQDVPNTVQGRWFSSQMATSENPELALVHDNIDPTIPDFSVGNSIPSLPSGLYTYTPAASPGALVNPDFAQVTQYGTTYCFEDPSWTNPSPLHILLQMLPIPVDAGVPAPPTAMVMQIAGASGSTCGTDPTQWNLGPNPAQFTR